MTNSNRITALQLDEVTIRYHRLEIKQEREMAISDLLNENYFELKTEGASGPYRLHLSVVDQKLFLRVNSDTLAEPQIVILSLRSFRKLIKDYFMMWEAYSHGLANATPEKLQALDMARRAVHNEGADLVEKALSHSAETNFNTARRLFTLICVLHIS